MGVKMKYRTWLKVSAIVELTGFSKRKVMRDLKRFQWPSTTYRSSPIRLYAADAIENSYGMKFQSDNVSMIAGKLNKLAVYEEFTE